MAEQQTATGTTADGPAGTQPREEAGAQQPERESLLLMIGLSAGHGVKHLCQGALLIMLPSIKSALNLSDVATGGIFTGMQISSGVANAPAGILTDMFRKHVALMLTASMICVALAYLLIGITQWYLLILLAVVILGTGTSLWHAPAFATLAARYPERRGLAMSAHLTGAQAGDSSAPILIGFLLGGFTVASVSWAGLDWRTLSLLLTIPAAATAVFVLLRFKSGALGAPPRVSFREYGQSTLRLVKNPGVLGMVSLHAIRGATHQSFRVFLVIYMSEVLGYSPFIVGFHVSLLTLAGVASTPIMGSVSDRIGRKPVIVSEMAAISILILSIIWLDSGWPLTVLLALLGVVLFSVQPIVTAAAMDVTDRGSEGTSIAFMFAGGAVIGSLAPVIAGFINTRWEFQGVVIFAGLIAAIGAVVAVLLPIKKRD